MTENLSRSKLADLTDQLLGQYKTITLFLSSLLITGIVLTITGALISSGDLQVLISILGMALILGVIVGGTAGFWFGLILSWIIPIPVVLVLGVYIGFLNFGAIGAVFSSYAAPIIAGVTGWVVSVKKSKIDKDVEYEYLIKGNSLFSRD